MAAAARRLLAQRLAGSESVSAARLAAVAASCGIGSWLAATGGGTASAGGSCMQRKYQKTKWQRGVACCILRVSCASTWLKRPIHPLTVMCYENVSRRSSRLF